MIYDYNFKSTNRRISITRSYLNHLQSYAAASATFPANFRNQYAAGPSLLATNHKVRQEVLGMWHASSVTFVIDTSANGYLALARDWADFMEQYAKTATKRIRVCGSSTVTDFVPSHVPCFTLFLATSQAPAQYRQMMRSARDVALRKFHRIFTLVQMYALSRNPRAGWSVILVLTPEH